MGVFLNSFFCSECVCIFVYVCMHVHVSYLSTIYVLNVKKIVSYVHFNGNMQYNRSKTAKIIEDTIRYPFT